MMAFGFPGFGFGTGGVGVGGVPPPTSAPPVPTGKADKVLSIVSDVIGGLIQVKGFQAQVKATKSANKSSAESFYPIYQYPQDRPIATRENPILIGGPATDWTPLIIGGALVLGLTLFLRGRK